MSQNFIRHLEITNKENQTESYSFDTGLKCDTLPNKKYSTQSVAFLTKYLLIHYGLTQSDIAVHEDVAAKTEGEARTVYNDIKEYL